MVRAGLNPQPWIISATGDSLWIFAPMILPAVLVVLFPQLFSAGPMPLWFWVATIMCIDVAHVYSTLYRTYFHPEESSVHSGILWAIPLTVWILGVMLYSSGSENFWTVLAYLAVFHFVRQQYGFLKIYSRFESRPIWERRLDAAAVYIGALYPILYWHAHLPREFHWFVDGDFLNLPIAFVEPLGFAVFVAVLSLFFAKEIGFKLAGQSNNWPKIMVVSGTALTWYVGIVLYNADMAFTFTNVLAHGIPYLALVWIFGRRAKVEGRYGNLFSAAGFPIFIGLLIGLAFLEEGLWHGFVWRDHLTFFKGFAELPPILDQATLGWIIPLLAVPQATHYVLDGFIWKIRKNPKELFAL